MFIDRFQEKKTKQTSCQGKQSKSLQQFFLINIYSRSDAHQPVSVQPGTNDEVYTFANDWHSSLCGSFTPCHRGVC